MVNLIIFRKRESSTIGRVLLTEIGTYRISARVRLCMFLYKWFGLWFKQT